MKSKPKFKIYFLQIIIIGILTALDQLSKFIVTSNFELYESKVIIKNVFSLTYIQNTGVAFGMLKGQRVAFIILTMIILGLCIYIYTNIAGTKKFLPVQICILFLISGAIGNMIDRVKLGYVIDYFDFDLINFPVFNVADIYVTVSTIILFLLLLFKYNDDEFNTILGIKSSDKNNDKSNKDNAANE